MAAGVTIGSFEDNNLDRDKNLTSIKFPVVKNNKMEVLSKTIQKEAQEGQQISPNTQMPFGVKRKPTDEISADGDKGDVRNMTYLPIGMNPGDKFMQTKRGTTFMKSTRHGGMTNAKMGGSAVDQHPPQMQSNLIDLTHDTLPEIKWRPIKKMPEQIPEPKVINNKADLHHWEMAIQKEHYSYTYDRRYFDNLVFKKFIGNGKIIKMLVDPNDLAGATNFWKTEDELTKVARDFIKKLR